MRSVIVIAVAALAIAACDREVGVAGPAALTDAQPSFVGSAACGTCHSKQAVDWHGSDHDLAMQEANESSVLGDFSDASFEYFGETSRFVKRDGKYVVHTAGADGKAADFPVRYTFGVRPLQQYLVALPRGRLQTLPFAWDTRPAAAGGQRWLHMYPDEPIGPHDSLFWTGREQNWNFMCAECHSTQVELGYNAAEDSFRTTWQEIDVGCEACHGPGSTHAAQAQSVAFDAHYGLAVDLDDRGDATWKMNPDTGIAARSKPRDAVQRQPEACGRCHARRGVIAARYEYGKPLADTHLPSLLHEPLYFADGQMHEEVYVYGSFLQSRMYRAGVTCSDCHNPHSLKLVTGDDPNAVCAQCHLPAKFATEQHGHHAAQTAGCVDCHMTARTYMQVDDRHDHGFRVPRPDLTVQVGIPNACNRCHEDKDGAWAKAAVEKWYGDQAFQRPEFATAFAAARRGQANEALRAVVESPEQPKIAQATALTLMEQPYSDEDLDVLGTSIADPDPLVRIAAYRVLGKLPAETRSRFGYDGLGDPVRAVRMESARAYADLRDLLSSADAANFRAAADDYRSAYEYTANRPESVVHLGDLELAMGNPDAAMSYYQRALHMEPASVVARVNLADAYRASGLEADAERVLRQGRATNPDNAALEYSLGLLLARTGRKEESLAALRKAARLEPDNRRYAYVLGVALNSLGEGGEALARLEAARQRYPADFDIAWALATMYRDRGDLEKARDIADELLRRHPDRPEVIELRRSLTVNQALPGKGH